MSDTDGISTGNHLPQVFSQRECREGARVKKLETRVYKRLSDDIIGMKKEIEKVIREAPLNIMADQNVDTERAHMLWQQQKIQMLYTMQENTMLAEQKKKSPDQKVINRCIRTMINLLTDASPEVRKSNMAQHEMKYGKRSVVVKKNLPNVNDWLGGKEGGIDNTGGQKDTNSKENI